jgi:hypothetical protein
MHKLLQFENLKRSLVDGSNEAASLDFGWVKARAW